MPERNRLPSPNEVELLLARADAVRTGAEVIRREQRRRRRPDREAALSEAVVNINAVTAELRRLNGASTYRPVYRSADLHESAERLRVERRKLHKMLAASSRGMKRGSQ